MTRGAEARLFVALDLPADARAEIAGWARSAAAGVRAQARAGARGLAGDAGFAAADHGGQARADRRGARAAHGCLRLLGADALHVTLCFLGNQPVAEIEALGDALALACAEAPPIGGLALGAPLWLPSRRPRALAVELHDTPDRALAALHASIATALAGVCDFQAAPARTVGRSERKAHRRFRPHVTVARLRSADAPRERALPATPAVSFLPPSATLYRSWLTPTEAVYEGLATCALGHTAI